MPRKNSHLKFENLGELLHDLGDVAPKRVRLIPPPGQATGRDLLRLNDHTNRLYELVDGVLVEKVMGFEVGYLAQEIGRHLGNFATEHDLGIVTGADSPHRLFARLIRLPDVSFVSWDRLPGKTIPAKAVPDLVPDLAVEVLSIGNTKGEMQRKLKEYFLAGVRLVWFVNPRRRTAQVYTAPDVSAVVTEGQTLDGGDVLPGFKLSLRTLFARVPPAVRAPRRRRGGAA
jgi:Uma2 family endonuclease